MVKSNVKSSLWTVPAKLSPFYKWLIIIALVSIFAALFPWLFELLGDISRIFIFVFIIPAVLFWGLKGGLIVALVTFLAMITFYQVSGEKFTGGLIGPLFLFLIVIIVGRMRDLSLQLEKELIKKQTAELELENHQANLEKRINERTVELSLANHDLEHEIAERKLAEKALQESEEKYRQVIENVNEAIVVSQDGKLKFFNPKAVEISGCSESELMLKPFIDFVHPEDRQLVMQHHLKRMNGEAVPEVYELRHITQNGQVKWFENNGVIITWEGRVATLNLLNDITGKKLAEKELADAKNQWEQTFEAVWDWVAIIDQNHTMIRSNKAYKNFMDLPPDQIIGKKCYDIVHKMACPISDCPLKRSLLSRQRENMEIQLENGRWVMISVDPIKSQAENGLFVHIVRDITENKNRENEILTAQKAEAFSILSGGIAHDYNNLLAIIWGNISLLKEEIPDAFQQEFFLEAEKACEQARSLTHQFITLSKGAMFTKRVCSITDILQAAGKTVGRTQHVNISWRIQDTIPAIEVDPEHIAIAFQHIIQNSVDALSSKGRLDITVEVEPLYPGDQDSPGRLKIAFTDTGTGISQSDLPKVFDPYFTTKKMGFRKGSGLGLSVSKAIIKKHGGEIQINSRIGKGTSVMVYLPLPQADANVKSNSNRMESSDKPHILCMDDNLSIIKLCVRMLESLNCRAITAGNAKEAIQKYEDAANHHITVDLLLLDQHIQDGPGGIETLAELRKCGYAGNAIVVTGSPSSPAILAFKKYGFDGKLLKPYTKKELADVISPFVPV